MLRTVDTYRTETLRAINAFHFQIETFNLPKCSKSSEAQQQRGSIVFKHIPKAIQGQLFKFDYIFERERAKFFSTLTDENGIAEKMDR